MKRKEKCGFVIVLYFILVEFYLFWKLDMIEVIFEDILSFKVGIFGRFFFLVLEGEMYWKFYFVFVLKT